DDQHLSGDIVVGLQEEADSARDILRLAKTSHSASLNISVILARADRGFSHPRDRSSWGHYVDPQIGRSAPLLCENPTDMNERGLGSRVVHTFLKQSHTL